MTQTNGKYTLILRCKDLQMYEIEFNNGDECLNVASSIEKLSHIGRKYNHINIIVSYYNV